MVLIKYVTSKINAFQILKCFKMSTCKDNVVSDVLCVHAGRCLCAYLLPEQGCSGDVGGVSGTLQWFVSLLRP